MRWQFLPAVGLFAVLSLGMVASAFGSSLFIANKTDSGILNILAKTPQKEFFFRVDLLPGSKEEVENPGGKAVLRADTGLEFWTFPTLDLSRCKGLTFCPEHGVCLIVDDADGIRHVLGERSSLGAGSKPVCNLDKFHSAMTMGDVCAMLPGEMHHDDNGALLTGIGFGGMTWAARLVPAFTDGKITKESLLEHLELRRPLNKDDFVKLLDSLVEWGYAPWQAEFPGIDLEFDNKADIGHKKEILLNSVAGFLAAHQQKGHKNHSAHEKCDEASIIFAPARLLPVLETADDPPEDVQIYTVLIRPCTRTLLLDVAAYRSE